MIKSRYNVINEKELRKGNDTMNIGEYIKTLRTSAGYSQEQLGNLVGVQRAAVQKWECGRVQNLKRETIAKLAEIFNVPASSFIDDETDIDEDLIILNRSARRMSPENRKKLIEMAKIMFKEDFDD